MLLLGGVCVGDSGGPAFYRDQHGEVFQVGVINSTSGNCSDTAPNVIVSITAYADWIEEHMPPLSWQNPVNQYDVDNDGRVVPMDVLLVINALNSGNLELIPGVTLAPHLLGYVDVNGNGILGPIDVLHIINYIIQ